MTGSLWTPRLAGVHEVAFACMKQIGKVSRDATVAEVLGRVTANKYRPPTGKELKLTKGCVGTAVVKSMEAVTDATSVAHLRRSFRRLIADPGRVTATSLARRTDVFVVAAPLRSLAGLVVVALLAVAVWALAGPWTEDANNAVYWVGCTPIAVLGGALLRHGMQFLVGPVMALAQFAHYLLFTDREQNRILVTVVFTMMVWTVVSVLAWGLSEVVRRRSTPWRR